jgi:hypothetical protein
LKKISYTLNLGLVGSYKSGEDSGKGIFIDFLKDKAVEYNLDDYHEFLIIFNQIPIRMKIFPVEDFNELILNYDKIKKLDIIVLTLNMHEFNSINEYEKQSFEEFEKYYKFRGSSILVGIDVEKIYRSTSKNSRISYFNLIKKAKELNILYCFEIQNKNRDLSELYNKVLDDFIFKFQFSSPELFNQAKSYGKELSIKKKIIYKL